jgi:hypothetical protein
MLAGFVIWLAASIVLRLWGQRLLDPSSPTRMVALLALSAPVMFYLPRQLFARFAIEPRAFALGAIALVAPGMLLDAAATIALGRAYPNIAPSAAGLFGGWLLFCNAVALISAADLARRRSS